MTRVFREVRRFGLLLASGIVVFGCSPARHAAIELDKVARSVDRYGFASISTPFLSGPSDEFEFDLDKSAAEYFDLAFTPQGGVRHFRAEALDVQAAFRANIEEAFATLLEFQKVRSLAGFRLAKSKAAMQKSILESLPGRGPEGGVPAEGSDKPLLKRTPAVTALIGVLGAVSEMPEPELPEFTPRTQGLPDLGPPFTTEQLRALAAVGTEFTPAATLPDEPFRLSAREALMIAGGDVMTQTLLKWFMQPHGNKLRHYELFFCPMVVSVQPGYQTRDRYVADITVNVDLAKPATKCDCPRSQRRRCQCRCMRDETQEGDSPSPANDSAGDPRAGGEGVEDDSPPPSTDTVRNDIVPATRLGPKKCRCGCPCRECKPCDRHLEFLSDEFHDSSPPILVAGVFPVIDSQVLNLVNSRRQLYSVALQLSLMGFGSQADFFSNYAKRLERDAQTQTALTAASAYTVGDTAFGFRVEPKFVASKDPTQLVTEPGRILESRTFPAMAAVLVDRKYLKFEKDWCCPEGRDPDDFGGCQTENCRARARCSDCGSKEKDEYDYLVFETSTHWSPMTEYQRVLGGGLSLGGRYSEVEAWSRALALDKVDEWLRYDKRLIHSIDDTEHMLFGWNPPLFSGRVRSTHQRAHLESRAKILRRLALDSRAIIRVFDKGPAQRICVESVIPKHGWWDQHTVFTIRGQGFRHNVKYVTVGGIGCDFSTPNDRTLLVAVPPWGQVKKSPPEKLGGLSRTIRRAPFEDVGLRQLKAVPDPEVAGADYGPLTPEERCRLEVLRAKLADKDKSKDVTEKEKEEHCQLTQKQDKYEDHVARVASRAEIAIGANVPVCVNDACDEFPCEDCRTSRDAEGKCKGIGCVVFDKRLPKKDTLADGGDGKDKKGPKVTIKYHKETKGIESVETEGDFSSSARLLELIRDALKQDPDVDFQLDAGGSVKVGASAKTRSSTDPDEDQGKGPERVP